MATSTQKEGISAYKEGDFVAFNNPDMTDGYPISREKFQAMYVEADECTDCEGGSGYDRHSAGGYNTILTPCPTCNPDGVEHRE